MKFLFFLLAVFAMTCYVGAQIDCGDNTGCMCESVDNVKTLITCDGVSGTSINLNSKGITSVKANAFENNTNMTTL